MLLSDPSHAPRQLQTAQWRDHPEWHRGRPRYALWSIPVECPAVLRRMQAARELLGNWLHPPGARAAHITLFVCGFPCTAAFHDDDIPSAVLEAQLQDLTALQPRPFTLHIGALDSFASAAFLRVTNAGPLERLRETLGKRTREVRQAPYVPHLTLGLYRQAASAEDWHRRAAPLRTCTELELPVRELQLVSYAACEPAGALRVEQRLVLG